MATRLRIAAAFVAIAALAVPVAAQQRGLYVGAAVGDSDFQVGLRSFDDGSLTSGETDGSETGVRVFVGFRLGQAWAVEGGWVDFNADPDADPTFSGVSDGSGAVFPAGAVSRELEPQGVYTALVVYAYSGRRLDLFLQGGYLAWRADATTIDAVSRVDDESDGTDLMYGAGAELRILKRLALRADWGRFKEVAGDDIELATLGLSFAIGRR